MSFKKIKEYLEIKESKEYNNWKSIGLFDNIGFDVSYELFLKLEEMRNIMLSDMSNREVDVIMIPIVIRTYTKYNHMINDIRAAYMYVVTNLYRLHELKQDEEHNKLIDAEVVFSDSMAKEIADLKL